MIIYYIIEKTFLLLLFTSFSTEEMLKRHIEINGKKRIIMPKKSEYVKFKYYESKIKSSFIICSDF